jgi:hypothetical protein
MQQNDAGAATIRDYLHELLLGVLVEREGFSGKRPFGNSGWEYDLYQPLIKAGLIDGELDEEYGYINSVDRKAGDEMILDAVDALFGTPGQPS